MPAPKARPRAGGAGGIEAVRVGEARRVAAGGGEQAADGVAAAEAVAEGVGVLEREAGEEVERRVEAQQLLDGGGRGRGAGEEPGRIEPGGEDGGDAVADGVHRRLVAGVEQEDAGRRSAPRCRGGRLVPRRRSAR